MRASLEHSHRAFKGHARQELHVTTHMTLFFLTCRNLMAKQDLAELGLVEENSKPQAQAAQQQAHKG